MRPTVVIILTDNIRKWAINKRLKLSEKQIKSITTKIHYNGFGINPKRNNKNGAQSASRPHVKSI